MFVAKSTLSYYISKKIQILVTGIAAWEITLVSPFEVSTVWTAVTKQKIPYSKDKHAWEIHALKDLKVGKQEQKGGGGRSQKRKLRRATQTCSQELMAGLSWERGGICLWVMLPSAGKSRENCWAFLQEWAVWAVSETRDLGQDTALGSCFCCLGVGIPERKTDSGSPITPWPPRTCLTLPLVSSCKEHHLQTQELVLQIHYLSWAKGVLCNLSWARAERGPCRGLRSLLLLQRRWPVSPANLIPIITDSSLRCRGGQHWDFTEIKISWFNATYWKIIEKPLHINLLDKCHSYVDV